MKPTPLIHIGAYDDTKHMPTLLNPDFKPLTVEKLRTFAGYENISEQDDAATINSIQQFALVLYGCFKNNLVENLNKESFNQNPVIPIFQKFKNKAA